MTKINSVYAHHGREGYNCGPGNGHQGDVDSYGVPGNACVGSGCCDHAPYEPGNNQDYTCGNPYPDGTRWCSLGGGGPPPNTPVPTTPLPSSTPIPTPTVIPTPTTPIFSLKFLGIKLGKVSNPTIGGFQLPFCPVNIGLFNFRILLPCIIPWVG